MPRLAVFSPGLLRLGPEMRLLSGLDPHFTLLSPRGYEAAGGWGHKLLGIWFVARKLEASTNTAIPQQGQYLRATQNRPPEYTGQQY